MHQTSYDEMARMLNKHLGDRFNEPLEVLDVGSRQVEDGFGKTYRDLMPTAWRYTGCDGLPGPNVDLVCLEAYRIQESGECYDLVISGQCLEHVELPHLLVCEMARMCRPGGWLIVTAPWQWHYHPHPLDCWRILPHGMEALFRFASLEVFEAYLKATECWGVARGAGHSNTPSGSILGRRAKVEGRNL